MNNLYVLNAFAKTALGGNPAGVILQADNIPESEMQKIAQKAGFSETAFVMKSDLADYKLRFFTPVAEVDLCGHATIAAFSLLVKQGLIQAGYYTQETKAGILDIEIKTDHTIFMQQKLPNFGQKIFKKKIAHSLSISESQIVTNLPVQIVSTGLSDIIIPVKNMETLNSIKPDFRLISEISANYKAVGYHLFCLETLHENTAHCRNLAPLFSIDEEAATGTASGALACYLFQHGLITSKQISEIVFEQGYCMNRPSEILIKLEINKNLISKVWIGGTAKFITSHNI